MDNRIWNPIYSQEWHLSGGSINSKILLSGGQAFLPALK